MKYRSDIDGLRAFSVLTVILFHLDFTFLSGGFIGVDTFFVISGYLISTILISKCEAGNFSFADFYMRRVKRIFPALFTVLAFTMVLGFFFLSPELFKNMTKDVGVASLQFSNFRFADKVDYFQQSQLPSTVLHTWSLGVEEQFYLVWPILIWLTFKLGTVNRLWQVLGTVFVVSFGLNLALIDSYPQSTFFLLHTRAWELALGGLLALYHHQGGSMLLNKKSFVEVGSWLAFFALMACSVFYTEEHFPGMKAVLPCVAAAAIIHFGRAREGSMFNLLSLKPIVYIGLISYGLYLWHWPLIVIYKAYTLSELTLMAQLGLLTATFALTIWCYYKVELPLRYSKFTPKFALPVGVLAMGVMFGLTALIRPLSYDTVRFDSQFSKADFSYSKLANKCHQRDEFNPEKFCVIGDKDAKVTALLSGASHAGHYTDMMDQWGKENGVQVTVVSKNGCTLWLDVAPNADQVKPDRQKCMGFQQEFKEWIKGTSFDYAFLAVRSDAIVNRMLKNTPDPAERYTKGLQKSLELVSGRAHQTIFLGQVPIYSYSPPNCYYTQRLYVSKLFQDIDKASHECLMFDREFNDKRLSETTLINKQVTQDMGISYYDPVEPLFRLNDGSVPFYKDNDHLTAAGSLALVPSFSEFVGKPQFASKDSETLNN